MSSYLAPPAKCRWHVFHHECPQPRASYQHTPIRCVGAWAYPPPCMHVLAASQPRTPAALCTCNMWALSARPRELAAPQPRTLTACRVAASQPCGLVTSQHAPAARLSRGKAPLHGLVAAPRAPYHVGPHRVGPPVQRPPVPATR